MKYSETTGQKVIMEETKCRNTTVFKWSFWWICVSLACVKTGAGLNRPPHDPVASAPRSGSSGRPEVWRFLTTTTFLLLLLHFWAFLSEIRHWINYVDYEGPPCSLVIIKKGYPGGELCSNFARKCVSTSGLVSWLSAGESLSHFLHDGWAY